MPSLASQTRTSPDQSPATTAVVVVGEDGLEGEVAERLELALLGAVLVPEPGHPVAAGGDEPAVLGEPDRGDAAAVRGPWS